MANHICFSSHILVCILFFIFRGISGATFTFINSCDYTVWPGILSNAGSQTLGTTGFELRSGGSHSFQAPAGWSGRFWGRTGCNFDSSGKVSCSTGDCGSGQLECNGAGATPPATLAEFTLGSDDGLDFYDVSLVDGYNLPVAVAASDGKPSAGECTTTGCVADLNRQCPPELRVGDREACRSACEAFGRPEYCCSGEFSSPATCRPSKYSEMFKAACPRSYSYAYDDATSTFTCTGADYQITFCPGSTSLLEHHNPLPRCKAYTSQARCKSRLSQSEVLQRFTKYRHNWGRSRRCRTWKTEPFIPCRPGYFRCKKKGHIAPSSYIHIFQCCHGHAPSLVGWCPAGPFSPTSFMDDSF